MRNATVVSIQGYQDSTTLVTFGPTHFNARVFGKPDFFNPKSRALFGKLRLLTYIVPPLCSYIIKISLRLYLTSHHDMLFFLLNTNRMKQG